MNSAAFGERLRNLRRSSNLTIEQVAELLDLSISYWGLMERGNRTPSLETLISICKLFAVSLDYMVLGINEHSDKNTIGKALFGELCNDEVNFISIALSFANKITDKEYSFILKLATDLMMLFNKRSEIL